MLTLLFFYCWKYCWKWQFVHFYKKKTTTKYFSCSSGELLWHHTSQAAGDGLIYFSAALVLKVSNNASKIHVATDRICPSVLLLFLRDSKWCYKWKMYPLFYIFPLLNLITSQWFLIKISNFLKEEIATTLDIIMFKYHEVFMKHFHRSVF